MDHAAFWTLIDRARAAPGPTSRSLALALAQLPEREIAEFEAWFSAYYLATSREDLWAAVYAIRGGCGDDSFDYFRGWLIGRGEAALLAAIRDPESLAELIGDADPRDESMLGAAREAYRRVAGGELPAAKVEVAIPGLAEWPPDRVEHGVKWNAKFYAATFPRLHARYFANHEPGPTGSIEMARFWSIVAGARDRADNVADAARALEADLGALTKAELIGFTRWLDAYNQALMRRDVRAACRVLLGQDDTDTVAGFRGWLLVQGEQVVHAALHDLDAILDHATHPVAACIEIIFITRQPLRAHQIYSTRFDDDDDERIPDRATWSPDWTAVETPTPAQLRERFPRLTANLSDIQLSGPYDASRLSTYERQRLAINLLERAKATADDRAKLELLDRADALWPSHQEIRGARGRVHARLGNLDTALADFDAVLAVSPNATRTQWERSKVRLARGDRDGALADARSVAQSVDEARAWLAEQARITPKRVRHVKFGEGVVVSADTTSNEPKLVIDFASGRKTIASRFVDAIE